MDPQFGDGHDISDRGEIDLAGTDHLRGRDDESKSEGAQVACPLRLGTFSDDFMHPFLQSTREAEASILPSCPGETEHNHIG